MPAADFVTAVLALGADIDCLLEMQEDGSGSGLPQDSSGNGNHLTSIGGSPTYEVAGPDGTDLGIRLNGATERSSPMNTQTTDTGFGAWIRWVSSSVNHALVENGNPGANGYGGLLVANAAIRGIAHGVGFKSTGAFELDDGLWHFVGLQITGGGSWELYFDGQPDANNPIGSGGIATPTTKFVIARDGAVFEVAYLFSLNTAQAASVWEDLYAAMFPPVEISGVPVVGRTLTASSGSTFQWESSADGSTGWSSISGETSSTYVVEVGEIGNFLRCQIDSAPSNVLGPVVAALSGPVVVVASDGDHSNGYSPTTYTPDTSSVLAGDLMIVSLESAFTGGTGEITVPDGWTAIEYEAIAGSGRGGVWWKFTLEDTPTEVFGFPSAASFVGTITVVRGAFDPEDPITDNGRTTDNSLTTVGYDANDLVLGITIGNDVSTPADVGTLPSGFTSVIEEAVSALTVSGWCTAVAKLEASGSGSTSGLSFTYNVGTDLFTETIHIVFAPAGDVPVVSVDPVVTGVARVAETLSVTDGTWSETPTSFSYDWERSADGSTGWSDVGPDADTYVIDIADTGFYFRCKVTASNGSGAGVAATSNVVGPADPYPTIRRFTVSG